MCAFIESLENTHYREKVPVKESVYFYLSSSKPKEIHSIECMLPELAVLSFMKIYEASTSPQFLFSLL